MSSFTPEHNEPAGGSTFERRIEALKRRLIREATQAIGMLETALDALWSLDVATAREVNRHDDRIDVEEVAIEQECFQILALHHAFARDFRTLAFIIKVNSDVERLADHASSIAKLIQKIEPPIVWPTSLQDLGERVPLMAHDLMRAVLDEDAEAARTIVSSDTIIDGLDRRLFDEVQELMARDPSNASVRSNGLRVYRIGRELERVGDILSNVAEDVVYLATGEIVRHAKKRGRFGPGVEGEPGA